MMRCALLLCLIPWAAWAQNTGGSSPGTRLYLASPVGCTCTPSSPTVLYASQFYNCQNGFYALQTFNNPMTTVGDMILSGMLGTATRLAIGTNGYVLTSNGTSASWQPTSTTSTANIAGGLLGSIPYQSAVNATTVLAGNTASTDQVLVSHGTGSVSAIPTFSNAPALSAANMTSFPTITSLTYGAAATSANCLSIASPAVCAAAPAGTVTIASGATTKVVNTTAVTANSEILVLFDSSLGTRLGVTCNATVAVPTVSARTAATSFTISTASAPSVNPACYSYMIVN